MANTRNLGLVGLSSVVHFRSVVFFFVGSVAIWVPAFVWESGFPPRPLASGSMSATLPLVRQRGASSSSHGVGVSAGSLCVSTGLKVASYNIGTMQDKSHRGKREDSFGREFSIDLCRLAPVVNVLCMQESSRYWATSMQGELPDWAYVWEDTKVIAWDRNAGVKLVWHEWRKLWPNSASDESIGASCGQRTV